MSESIERIDRVIYSIATSLGYSGEAFEAFLALAKKMGISPSKMEEFSLAMFEEFLVRPERFSEEFFKAYQRHALTQPTQVVNNVIKEFDSSGPHHHPRAGEPKDLGFGYEGKPAYTSVALPDETLTTMRLVAGLRGESVRRMIPEKHMEVVDGGLQIITTPFKEGFRWMRDKKYKVPESFKGIGYLYAFRTLSVPMTLNGAQWSIEEKRLAARTLIGQPINLNHKYHPEDQKTNLTIDSEFEDGWIEGFAFVTDTRINRLYERGDLVGVSVEYYPRHEDWANGWSCEGNRFVGLAFVSKEYTMGSPESTVTRLEAIPALRPLTQEDESMSGIEGKTREEVLVAIEQTEATLEELRSKLSAFDSTEGSDVTLEVATLKAQVKGMSGKLDRLELALKEVLESGPDGELPPVKPVALAEPDAKIEVLPPRQETVLSHEDGEETATLLDEEGNLSADPDEDLLRQLDEKQKTHAKRYGE